MIILFVKTLIIGGCIGSNPNSKSHLTHLEVKVNHMEIGSGPNSPSNFKIITI